MKKKITKEQYAKLMPASAEYRKQLYAATGIAPSKNYTTLFTEPRAYGSRTKFWRSRFSFEEIVAVTRFISKHRTINVHGVQYLVEFVPTRKYFQSSGHNDRQLVFTKI